MRMRLVVGDHRKVRPGEALLSNHPLKPALAARECEETTIQIYDPPIKHLHPRKAATEAVLDEEQTKQVESVHSDMTRSRSASTSRRWSKCRPSVSRRSV